MVMTPDPYGNDDPYDHWNGPYNPDPFMPAPAATPAPAEAAVPPTGGANGGGGGGASAFSPSGKPQFSFLPVPKFTAAEFVPPDAQSILNSPGYQFRVNQGQQGIERSAAAKGLLRTGGTLKDISEYNQNFASNEYGNEFSRALQTHMANYQGDRDEYAPLLAEWNMLSQAELQAALAAYGRDTVWNNPHAGGGGGGYGPIIMPAPTFDPSLFE